MATPPETTTCCVVGCGPAGAMLGLILARAGVEVLVLEKHEDFFRDFRGDTIHPSTLDLLDELDLGARFDRIPQQRVSRLGAQTDGGYFPFADFRALDIAHPYIAFVPQWDFLDLLSDAARELPHFELRMGAEVVDTVEDAGRISGVRYRSGDELHEVRATLTVATDGRNSVLRRRAGLRPVTYGAPMDVLWFRLSHEAADPSESFGRLSRGHLIAAINRGEYWQVGYVISKGSDSALREQGIEKLRRAIGALIPLFAERARREPASWNEVKTLEVQVDRLRRWHRPGLLCIGDAAHAMSPIGGVGINLAVQDAVAAANILAEPLRAGTLRERDLARVARRRWLPTVVTQAFQRAGQRLILARTLRGAGPRLPKPLRRLGRAAFLRRVPARLIGVGVLPEHVRVPAAGARDAPAPPRAAARVTP